MARAAVRPVVKPKLLRLVSWNPQAAAERALELEKAGFKVQAGPAPTKQLTTHFRDLAPAAIVIDMDKLPSHGRAVGVVLRTTKSTRHLPLVFAGGEPEKVKRARRDMPDACFTDWKRAARAIKQFIVSAPATPIQPPAYMDQFAGSSTIQKLGFKAGMKIATIGAPEGFEEQLGELPENLEIGDRLGRQTQLALWFVRSRHELESEIDFMGARLPEGCSIWIIHPKQTSRLKADFNQNHVRSVALKAGLVDYKVCSVDSDWSGLKFARKKR
jgi:hypothetical protein